jgi:hypothetical protein
LKAQKRKNQRIYIVVAVAAVLIVSGVLLVWRQQAWHKTSASPSPSVVAGNSTYDEPSASPSPEDTGSTVPTSSPNNGSGKLLAKPILQKSSGNAPGSSVPGGAMMEFSCEGTAGLTCEVLLTDRNASGRVISAGKKTIVSNGRGQNLALIDWTAVSGSWNVTARVSDTAGNSATSDTQTLEVN